MRKFHRVSSNMQKRHHQPLGNACTQTIPLLLLPVTTDWGQGAVAAEPRQQGPGRSQVFVQRPEKAATGQWGEPAIPQTFTYHLIQAQHPPNLLCTWAFQPFLSCLAVLQPSPPLCCREMTGKAVHTAWSQYSAMSTHGNGFLLLSNTTLHTSRSPCLGRPAMLFPETP